MVRQITRRFASAFLALAPATLCAQSPPEYGEFACRPLACSSLVPASSVDDASNNDCGYRNGNQWWVDYVAGSLTWNTKPSHKRITVALFDDGAQTEHTELRNQLWTNEREARGKPRVDDDRNGYVDDVHGWDFVDDDADVSPQGECVGTCESRHFHGEPHRGRAEQRSGHRGRRL